MQTLVTRFHLLLLAVTLATTGVAAMRIAPDFTFPAHWHGSTPDWIWPREAILVAPIVQLGLLTLFFGLGRALSKNQYAKSQHILDPALTLPMLVVTATQFGLLLAGIGSDLDFIRLTGFGLGCALFVLGVVLFGAERHTYAGLRMPWPVGSGRAWKLVHRSCGVAFSLAGFALIAWSWLDPGLGPLVVGFAVALLLPCLLAAVLTLTVR